MNLLPCPFCGAKAQEPRPIADTIGQVIEHTEDCFLFRYEAIVETCFYEDSQIKTHAWNSRLLQFPVDHSPVEQSQP